MGVTLDETADQRSRQVAAIRAREESSQASLGRIAAAVERISPPLAVVRDKEGPEFSLALAVAALRTCPDAELVRRVPARFFEPVDRVAVMVCPCEHVSVCAQGWTSCEGCDRIYLWTGSRMYAVSAPVLEEVQDRCDHVEFVAVPGSRPRCQACGISA